MPFASSTLAIISLVISVAMTVAKLLFAKPPAPPRQLNAPAAADGKQSLRQSVPSRRVILGTVKVAPDYLALLERNGHAHQIMVNCSHEIDGIEEQYFHDEEITITPFGGFEDDQYGGPVSGPAHFENYVWVEWRHGIDVESAFAGAISEMPDLWTVDHRGDGLATVHVITYAISQEKYMKVFPHQLPQYSNVVRGAKVYDPREISHDPEDKNTWTFSRNFALLRLHHITHVSGGRRKKSDLYMPSWVHAANVADQVVYNKNGDPEFRYHGGYTYRYADDQVEVGHILDGAGEMVIYERADGLIAVHAGEFYTPTFRVTKKDLKEINYDANMRTATNVLATRGRWTDPETVYNEADAAIFGDPYAGDGTERTKEVKNLAVQSHNHIQRLQKLAEIRANAPRVALQIVYNPTTNMRNIVRERFITVHYPDLGLNEAIIELTGRPKRSLINHTITIEGILVTPDMYDFDPETEEGEYSSDIPDAGVGGVVPEPEDFAVSIGRANINGRPVVYAIAEWTFQSDSFTYEFEWQYVDEREPPQSVFSKPEETRVQSGFLSNDEEYRFRLRTWSNQVPSEWTDYITVTVEPDSFNKGATFASTAYMYRGADITGITDGKTCSFSTWIKMNSGDGANQVIMLTNHTLALNRFGIWRNASNKIRVRTRDSAGTQNLAVDSVADLKADGNWHHLLVSFNLATSSIRIYLDDVATAAVPTTMVNSDVDFTSGDFFIAADNVPSSHLTASLADLWFDTDYLDFNLVSNRRKFIDAEGQPKYLGEDGEIPLVTPPLVYLAILPTDVAGSAFVTNRGTGGGFTLSGSLGIETGPS